RDKDPYAKEEETNTTLIYKVDGRIASDALLALHEVKRNTSDKISPFADGIKSWTDYLK
ncbi:hypothetical protein ACJMK2_038836, partial [Sinanodonta woodiana]